MTYTLKDYLNDVSICDGCGRSATDHNSEWVKVDGEDLLLCFRCVENKEGIKMEKEERKHYSLWETTDFSGFFKTIQWKIILACVEARRHYPEAPIHGAILYPESKENPEEVQVFGGCSKQTWDDAVVQYYSGDIYSLNYHKLFLVRVADLLHLRF